MRAMVMPLWSCNYMVMLTSLRESFMGGEEREMVKSRRERDNRQNSISGKYYGHFFHFPLKKLFKCIYDNVLPNFTI